MNILLIEDDLFIRLELEQTLRQKGHEVTACTNAETALEAYQQTFFPYVLLDLGLPGMSGFELCRHLRTLPDGELIQILVITAYSTQDALQTALEAGADDYLIKPVNRKQLQFRLAIMERHYHTRLQRQQAEDALRESERQLRHQKLLLENVINHIPYSVCWKDTGSRYMGGNKNFIDLFGQGDPERILGKRASDLAFQENEIEDMIATDRHVLETGEALVNYERQVQATDEQDVNFILVSKVPLHDEQHAIVGLVVIVTDITERKLREMALQEEEVRLKNENLQLKSTLTSGYNLGTIIGKSPAMQTIYDRILKAAHAETNVVICGESGTGKELIAHTIHRLSPRQARAFVPVNCGAVPESLFESEFFGYRKGAFTDARVNKPGLFDLAHEGSLFLDEVGELSPAMQVKLLRAIENGEYTPLGSNQQKTVDVRVIAATNKDLEYLLQHELMRRDFFYRIGVMMITVPPLRERKEDIPLLVTHFLEQYGQDITWSALPGNVLQKLYNYNWPGNVRELQNVLHRYLTLGYLDFSLPSSKNTEFDRIRRSFIHPFLSLSHAVELFEKDYIRRALEQHQGHKIHTAAALGITRRTLHRKIKQYRISPSYQSIAEDTT